MYTMNNTIRKEIKSMIEDEIRLYNANVATYNYYKDINTYGCEVAEKKCVKYCHSLKKLIKMANVCDPLYYYCLSFQNSEFYSPCCLVVKKAEG